MLVETVIQCGVQLLIELAIREVAVPAAKKLTQNANVQRRGGTATSDESDEVTSAPVLSAVRAVQVVSAIPGRLRVDVAGLTGKPELARRLDETIGALGGVAEATASACTGRMLVLYEPELQAADALVAAIDRARATHLSSAGSGSRRLAAVV